MQIKMLLKNVFRGIFLGLEEKNMWSLIKLIFYIGIIFVIWTVVRTVGSDKSTISNSVSQMENNVAESTDYMVNQGKEKIQEMEQNFVSSVQEEAREVMK